MFEKNIYVCENILLVGQKIFCPTNSIYGRAFALHAHYVPALLGPREHIGPRCGTPDAPPVSRPVSTNVGVDSSSRFPFKVQTNTNSQTPLITLHMYRLLPA